MPRKSSGPKWHKAREHCYGRHQKQYIYLGVHEAEAWQRWAEITKGTSTLASQGLYTWSEIARFLLFIRNYLAKYTTPETPFHASVKQVYRVLQGRCVSVSPG